MSNNRVQAVSGVAAAKSKRLAKLTQLKLRRRASGGELFVDYGWIKLLYSDDGDHQELYYHLDQEAWHAKDSAIYGRLLSPGDTVVDVGANMGFVTTMFAALVGPTGRVFSFEPSPKTFAKLRKTVAVNELEQVTPINFGIGATPETAELVSVSNSSGNNTLLPAEGEGRAGSTQSVKLVRLNEVPELQDAHIDLIKIDTEGFEFQVLTGSRELIERDRPAIYSELGGGGNYAHTTLEAIALLEELDYDTSAVAGVDWENVPNGADFLFTPRT